MVSYLIIINKLNELINNYLNKLIVEENIFSNYRSIHSSVSLYGHELLSFKWVVKWKIVEVVMFRM